MIRSGKNIEILKINEKLLTKLIFEEKDNIRKTLIKLYIDKYDIKEEDLNNNITEIIINYIITMNKVIDIDKIGVLLKCNNEDKLKINFINYILKNNEYKIENNKIEEMIKTISFFENKLNLKEYNVPLTEETEELVLELKSKKIIAKSLKNRSKTQIKITL